MLNNLNEQQFKGLRPAATQGAASGEGTGNGGASATTVVTVKGTAPTISTRSS